MLNRTRSFAAKVALALALLVPVPVAVMATAVPAVADGVGSYWCYEYDNQVWEHTEWYDDAHTFGWRTITYHHFQECTDGGTYWWWFMYEWKQSYYVQVV